MVVQPRESVFRCFRQHDHAGASSALASAWRWDDGTTPSAVTQRAIANHDIGWIATDRAPLLNPERERPHDFISLPLADRLVIYRQGIDEMERQHPYAGLLGSIHFSGFIHAGISPAFARYEQERRNRIGDALDLNELRVARDYTLLKALDLASLIVCLAQPGSLEHERPTWLGAELLVEHRTYALSWEGDERIVCTPSPFDAPVALSIPFVDVPRSACKNAEALAEAWENASAQRFDLEVR